MSEPLPPDPYADVVLHHTMFDWTDPTIDADFITLELCGYTDHWDEEEYKGMKPILIEKQILFEAKRPNWGGVSKWGKPYYEHFLLLIKLMFPDTDITPSLADAVNFFMVGLGGGNRKILNLIGSQNSGKSAAGCRIAFACQMIDPHYSVTYVASPFDSASDSTVWGDIEELWDQLCEKHPNNTGTGYKDATSLFPWGKKYANRYLEFIPNIPKAARIELRNTKHVGKYKGSKSRGKDVERGVMLILIDEVNEVSNMAFLETLNNITSQAALFVITSMNFKDEEDMGGRLCEPRSIFGGPSTYEELDIEEDAFWASAVSGVTLRFDGLKSPNILAGRTIYPKLFKRADEQRMREDYGPMSPDYFSQVRSFPARNDETNSVLSRAKISASRHKDVHYTVLKVKGVLGFVDPAFGGRDKAKYGFGYFAECLVSDSEGHQYTEELLIFSDFFHSVKLVKDATYPGDDDYWFNRMRAADISTSGFTLGSEVSYEDQIAITCKEYAKKHGIRSDCFGFDSSLRPDIVSSMNRMFGFAVNAFDYNQGPEGVFLQNIKQNSVDCCKNRNTELAFLAADMFLTKQIRGGSFIEAAVTQLSRTRYETINKKYVAEDKKAFKQRHMNASPDDRDCLLGICALAARRGFRQNVVGPSGSQGKSLFSEINASGKGKSKVGKRW